MSETNETRLAQYAEAIWGKANTNAAARAVMAVADVEQADYVAIIERLTSERDKAREDCGFQKGLKESIREELSTFIRLKAEAEAALASEREAHAALRARLKEALAVADSLIDYSHPIEDEGGNCAYDGVPADECGVRLIRRALAEPAAPVAAEEGGEQEAGEVKVEHPSWPTVQCTREYVHAPHTHINEGPHGGCGLPEWCPGTPAPSGSDEQGNRRATPDANGHDKTVALAEALHRHSCPWQGEWDDCRCPSLDPSVLAAVRAALAAGDPGVAEALGGRIDERFSPRFVDDGPCNGRCQTVACDDSHRGHRLEWRNLRRFVTDWTEA